MSKDDLEPKLAELMNQIPEVEGVIAFSETGKIISGQTIESMDKDKIATVINNHNMCNGKLIKKG